MELEEKFLQLLAVKPIGVSKEVVAIQCAKIADEWAIGFYKFRTFNDGVFRDDLPLEDWIKLYKEHLEEQHLKQSNNENSK
jgi:hypothetical protein